MLTLDQWELLNPTPLSTGVVEIFQRNNPVLAMMPFQQIAGNAYSYNQEETLPGVAFRAFNEAYDESVGVIRPETERLTILGGESDHDVALIAMQVGNSDARALSDAMKAKALTQQWLRTFFNGNSVTNPKEFSGLNERLVGDQVIEAGANGAALNLSMLDELIDAVNGRPDAIFMRKGSIRSYRALLRASGGIQPESIMVPNFGQPVIAHDGVPLIPIELDSFGNEILSGTEIQGSNSNTCSMYAVRFGLDALHGIHTAPVSVKDLGELESKPAFRTRIEWYSGLVAKGPRCAARLKGITNI